MRRKMPNGTWATDLSKCFIVVRRQVFVLPFRKMRASEQACQYDGRACVRSKGSGIAVRRGKSGRGLPHSKTCRNIAWLSASRSVVECGSPLPLFPEPYGLTDGFNHTRPAQRGMSNNSQARLRKETQTQRQPRALSHEGMLAHPPWKFARLGC